MFDTPLNTLTTLSFLFLPFIGMVGVVTEYITGITGWKNSQAKLTASAVGLVVGGLIVLGFWIPETSKAIGSVFFILLCIAGPSGGHDLVAKIAEKVGNK